MYDLKIEQTDDKEFNIKKKRGRPALTQDERQQKYKQRLEKQKKYQKQQLSTEEGKARIYNNYKKYFDAHKAQIYLFRNINKFINMFQSLETDLQQCIQCY